MTCTSVNVGESEGLGRWNGWKRSPPGSEQQILPISGSWDHRRPNFSKTTGPQSTNLALVVQKSRFFPMKIQGPGVVFFLVKFEHG